LVSDLFSCKYVSDTGALLLLAPQVYLDNISNVLLKEGLGMSSNQMAASVSTVFLAQPGSFCA